MIETGARKLGKRNHERIIRSKSTERRFRFETTNGARGKRRGDGERAAERAIIEGESGVKKRDVERRKTRFQIEKIKPRRGETACDDTAGEGVKTKENRKIGRRRKRKPGRGTVKKKRTNERTVKKRERFRRGTPGKRRNRLESKETRNGSGANTRYMRAKRESTVKGDTEKLRSRIKIEQGTS